MSYVNKIYTNSKLLYDKVGNVVASNINKIMGVNWTTTSGSPCDIIYDTFDGNSGLPNNWTLYDTVGSPIYTAELVNNEFFISTQNISAGNPVYVYLDRSGVISGDFYLTMDVHGIQNLGAEAGPTRILLMNSSRDDIFYINTGTWRIYFGSSGTSSTYLSSPPTSTSFKITRVGSESNLYYHNGSDWVLKLNHTSASTTDVYFSIVSINNNIDLATEIYIDNLCIGSVEGD